MRMRSLAPAALCILGASGACDDRQALHAPDPTLARMLSQRRADPFEPGVMRTPPPGTLPHDDADDGEDAPAPPLTRDLLALGRGRFDRFCAPCHGVAGDGVSVVAEKMLHRRPPSLHEARLRTMTRAELADVVTRGYGLMPGYADALPPRERWAVAAYVEALQLSRRAPVALLGDDDDARRALGPPLGKEAAP
jgi:mono/diheme cytochrome c family protein